jgi:hypothetical protein
MEETKEIKTMSVVDEVRFERMELEKIRDEIKNEREKIEALKVDEIIAGRTQGGKMAENQKTPEEIKKEGSRNFFKGTDIERALERYG